MNTYAPAETVLHILRDALRAALSTLDGAADATILPEQVSAHLMQWETTSDKYRARLPESAQHMGRSERTALGEALGGVALSSLDTRMGAYDLSKHDEQWNETALTCWTVWSGSTCGPRVRDSPSASRGFSRSTLTGGEVTHIGRGWTARAAWSGPRLGQRRA